MLEAKWNVKLGSHSCNASDNSTFASPVGHSATPRANRFRAQSWRTWTISTVCQFLGRMNHRGTDDAGHDRKPTGRKILMGIPLLHCFLKTVLPSPLFPSHPSINSNTASTAAANHHFDDTGHIDIKTSMSKTPDNVGRKTNGNRASRHWADIVASSPSPSLCAFAWVLNINAHNITFLTVCFRNVWYQLSVPDEAIFAFVCYSVHYIFRALGPTRRSHPACYSWRRTECYFFYHPSLSISPGKAFQFPSSILCTVIWCCVKFLKTNQTT